MFLYLAISVFQNILLTLTPKTNYHYSNKSPFIYHPKKDVYRFHDVFVERAAKKWEKERKELEAMEELKNQRWWKRSKSGRKGAGGGGRVEDLP